MTLIRTLSLLVFAVLGWRVSREDFDVGKIRNRRLLDGLRLCLVGYGLHLALSLAGSLGWVEQYLVYRFYSAALLHAAISLAFSLAFWIGGVWPAGDAKFFFLCAVFLPIIAPAHRAFPYYLSLNLLVNIFVLAAVYIVLKIALQLARSAAALGLAGLESRLRQRLGQAGPLLREKAAGWKQYLPYALNTGAIFLAQTIARPFLAGRVPPWLASSAFSYLLLVFAWGRVARFIASRQTAVFSGVFMGIAVCAALIWPPAHGWMGSFAVRWIGFGGFFAVARGLLESHMLERSRAVVDRETVAPGMVLSEKTVLLLKRDPKYFREHFTPLFKDGLSSSQAETLKQWLMGLPAEQSFVEVLQGSPFGAWIFGGALFTLVATRDAANIVLGLFR